MRKPTDDEETAAGATNADYNRMEEGSVTSSTRATASSVDGSNASTFVSTSGVSQPNSSRVARNFHRNQTVEVLPRNTTDHKPRPNSDLFRTFTESDLLSYRQRLLDDEAMEAAAKQQNDGTIPMPPGATNGGNNAANAPGRNSGGSVPYSHTWQLFYRNLPRTLRFRQHTRSTTRYIDPANAASLRSRLRAKAEEERKSFNDTILSPVPGAGNDRELTDFEQQMANLQDYSSGGDAKSLSSFHTTATPPTGHHTLTPKSSRRFVGRTESNFSVDSVAAGSDRKIYKIVKINGGGPPHRVLHPHVVGGSSDAPPAEEEEPYFASNEVITSQYSWWSFVPVFLYLTFQKIANLYFLLIGIFQMIPSISPTDGVPLQFVPLSIVIIIDAVFAGYEDYKRHVADDLANSAKILVFNRELREFEEVEWRDVKVSDFVKVKNHEMLPADVLILSVIPAEGSRSGGNTGVCYVETKNLDGETNLKLREAPQVTRNMFANEEDAGDVVQGYVESELPNGNINNYSGTLHLDGHMDAVPLGLKNMLLRGSKLRNTSYVYGLVVNTGVDSKIMMSSGDEFPVKVSSIDEMTNKQVGIVVVLLCIMSAIGAIGDHIWMKNQTFPSYYNISVKSIFGTFVYFFTTLASMVPITLYVSITLVKALQAYFMEHDLDMYDEESDSRMIARNMQLNEQLGQISHIFSDKTGTLTCNKMEFRKCSINGISYGKGTTAIGLAARMRSDYKGERIIHDESDEEDENDEYMKTPAPNVNFKDRKLWQDMKNTDSQQSAKIQEFFTHLALCHGVLIERMDSTLEGMEMPPIQYSASSPDEQALVCGAKYFGYEFVAREPGSVSIKNPDGDIIQYDILEVFEFDSTRKRMSVIVQRRKSDEELMQMTENDEDEVLVLTKGADNVLFPRLASNSSCPTNDKIRSDTLEHLESFARDGLRTLVICSKKLSITQWEAFQARYRLACTDLHQVEAKARGEKNAIDLLQEEMETNFELLGATAIEDRLQDGVPETMERLAMAGICIWVLTGDMEETAINIGYACRLLNNDMQRHVINAATFRTKGSILRELDKIFHSMYICGATDGYEELHSPAATTTGTLETTVPSVTPMKNAIEHALVIDGDSLNLILENPMYNLHLLRVALLCKVVIACRVSPQQKAQLVELVKLNVPTSHTLSIGDGANDVPMIQSAHIGIGISGQEGMQAVNSSDYALGQFRFLSTLLLVHGRWNYDRVAALVVYTFYKNIVYCVSMFWYALSPTAFSGTMIYSAFIQQGYNLFFTALPIMVYSVLDRDVPKNVVLKFPALYHSETRKHSFFTYQMFWKWIALAIIDSLGVYFVSLLTSYDIMRRGISIEYTVLESVAWTILCVVVNARFCLMVNSWDVVEGVSMILTILVLYAFQYVIDMISWSEPDYDTYSFPWIFGRSQFWLGQVFAVVAILMKDFLYESCRRRFLPAYLDLVREAYAAKLTVESEELAQYKPKASNYLNIELANMIDYHDRRAQERLPVHYTAPGRSQLYRGFAFDQPAHIFGWILAGNNTNRNGGLSRRSKAMNVQVRQLILHSDDPVIFENERYQPFCGFGSSYPGYLLPTDRSRWSDRSGKISAMVIPLAGLELDLNVPGCDADGWVYENDFAFFPSTPPEPESKDDTADVDEVVVSRRSSKASKQKIRGHHGLVRRRQWKLSAEYKRMADERHRDSTSDSLFVVED